MKLFFILLICLFANSFALPWLGLTYRRHTYDDRIELLVQGVHPESGAFNTGIENGDIITQFNERPIKSENDLKTLLKGKKTGDKITVTYNRNAKVMHSTIVLTDRPENISSFTGSAIGSKALSFGKNFYANAEKRNKKPKVTLLDFWATWCGPCRQAMPILHKLYKEHARDGLEIIGVSSESFDILQKFEREFKSPYPMYRDSKLEMWNRYRIASVPTLMLLDENGYILKVWHGLRSESALRDAVEAVLGNEKE